MTCYLDENLPPRLARALNELDEQVEVRYMRQEFPAATKDVQWIAELSAKGDCFVVTHDRGILSKPAERELWKQTQIPIYFMAKSWQSQSPWEQIWRFIRYWPEIKKSYRPNNSFLLSVNGKLREIGTQ